MRQDKQNRLGLLGTVKQCDRSAKNKLEAQQETKFLNRFHLTQTPNKIDLIPPLFKYTRL